MMLPFWMAPDFDDAPLTFRESVVQMNQHGGNAWRVTDPQVEYGNAREFLPNAVLPIEGVRLEGATSADVTFDYWSGHEGTLGKRFRWNGEGWMPLTEFLEGAEEPWEHLAQTNLTFDVPLDRLVEGTNTLEGTCDSNRWGWGQWGWYEARLRVYADDTPVESEIVGVKAGDTLSENPTFSVAIDSDHAIRQVVMQAYYEGPDENGDGILTGWHGMTHNTEWLWTVGVATEAPYTFEWDTEWIPDQAPGSIKLRTLIEDERGVWTVGKAIDGLSLDRSERSVKMFMPAWQPTVFWTRDLNPTSCIIRLDKGLDLGRVQRAAMHLRSWNVENNEKGYTPTRLNGSPWLKHITGYGHYMDIQIYDMPVSELREGDNLLTFLSETHHHGCEILWPGPALLLELTPETP